MLRFAATILAFTTAVVALWWSSDAGGSTFSGKEMQLSCSGTDCTHSGFHRHLKASLESFTSMPMVLNAGQGTTATRSMFNAACRLNLEGFHWTKYCQKMIGRSDEVNPAQVNALEAHTRVLKVYSTQMRRCLKRDRNSDDCSVKKGNSEIIDELKQGMRDVIGSGGVTTLFDTPYTRMLPFLIKEISLLTGMRPVILLSERDPQQWSKRRFDEGEHFDIHCRSIFDQEDAAERQNDEEDIDPFDFETCITRALQKDPPPSKLSDIFISNRELKLMALKGFSSRDGQSFEEYWKEHVLSSLARAMEKFQRIYEPKSVYHVNLFALEERLDDEALASDMFENIVESPKARQEISVLVKHGMQVMGEHEVLHTDRLPISILK
jgi:hypothetical protein